MSIYFYIAFFAAASKALLAYSSSKFEWGDSGWFFLVTAFLLQNVVESVAYHQFAFEVSPSYTIKAYFITLLVLLVSILRFVSYRQSLMQNWVFKASCVCATIISLIVLFTDRIVGRHELGVFPIRAIKGDFFNLYLLVGIAVVVLSFFFIYLNMRNKSLPKRESAYHLISLSPFLAMALFIGACMTIGETVNGSGFLPLASTFFMISSMYFRLTPEHRISMLIPFTESNALSKASSIKIVEGVSKNKPLQTILDDQEYLLIDRAITKVGKNKSKLSKYLQINPRTLDRRLDKHNLNW